MIVLMKEVMKYKNCFVCGDQNIHGLKAKFYFDGEKAFTEVPAEDCFEGYKGIYHGGVTAALLDEVMIKAILALGIYVVTAEMTVKYLKPVPVGERLTFTGKQTKNKGKLYFCVGEVTGQDGTVYAAASGKYIEARPGLKPQLMNSNE